VCLSWKTLNQLTEMLFISITVITYDFETVIAYPYTYVFFHCWLRYSSMETTRSTSIYCAEGSVPMSRIPFANFSFFFSTIST